MKVTAVCIGGSFDRKTLTLEAKGVPPIGLVRAPNTDPWPTIEDAVRLMANGKSISKISIETYRLEFLSYGKRDGTRFEKQFWIYKELSNDDAFVRLIEAYADPPKLWDKIQEERRRTNDHPA